jgi:zinc transport system substrate-binding protein
MLRALKINARSISALMFAGCAAAAAAATAPAAAKPPLVLASIKPVYGLTAFLMRGAGTPTLLLEGNPYLRRTPLNVDENALLKRGKLVIWIGPQLEHYLVQPLKQLKGEVGSLRLIDGPGIRLLGSGATRVAAATRQKRPARKPSRARTAVKKNRAGRRTLVIPRDGSAVNPRGKRATRQPANSKPAYTPRNRQITRADLKPKNPDPHIWLDPRNTISMARQIARALIKIDPANRRTYRRNLSRLIVRIETLDAEYRSSLQAIAPGRYAIIGAKTRYYESHYLLRPSSRFSVKTRTLDRNMIATVRRRFAQEGSRCIFGGTIFNRKALKSIGGRGKAIIIIDPYGLTRPADEEAYFAIMNHVTNRFVRCLDPAQATR